MRYGMREDDGGGGEKCPPGFYRACLVGIFDIGRQPGFKPGDSPMRKVMLFWEVDAKDSKGRNHVILDTVAAFLSTKPSKFSERIGALLGRALTDEECNDGVDGESFVGKTAMVFVVPPSGNGKWPKVDRAIPLPSGQAPMRPTKMMTEADLPKAVATARSKAVAPTATAPASIASPAPKAEPRDEIPF